MERLRWRGNPVRGLHIGNSSIATYQVLAKQRLRWHLQAILLLCDFDAIRPYCQSNVIAYGGIGVNILKGSEVVLAGQGIESRSTRGHVSRRQMRFVDSGTLQRGLP